MRARSRRAPHYRSQSHWRSTPRPLRSCCPMSSDPSITLLCNCLPFDVPSAFGTRRDAAQYDGLLPTAVPSAKPANRATFGNTSGFPESTPFPEKPANPAHRKLPAYLKLAVHPELPAAPEVRRSKGTPYLSPHPPVRSVWKTTTKALANTTSGEPRRGSGRRIRVYSGSPSSPEVRQASGPASVEASEPGEIWAVGVSRRSGCACPRLDESHIEPAADHRRRTRIPQRQSPDPRSAAPHERPIARELPPYTYTCTCT